ncbi:MAG: site-specific integrase [Candidatus Binatia bacterium]|nr:site-specific integrase [Candidatus Binatia bacterium]
MSYLERLPRAMKDGRCIYTPHSLRATTATALLDAGEPIESVQELRGHQYTSTTLIYDKRRRSNKDSASHNVPILNQLPPFFPPHGQGTRWAGRLVEGVSGISCFSAWTFMHPNGTLSSIHSAPAVQVAVVSSFVRRPARRRGRGRPRT